MFIDTPHPRILPDSGVRGFSLKDYVAARGQIGTTSGILVGNGLTVGIDLASVVVRRGRGSYSGAVGVDLASILQVWGFPEELQEEIPETAGNHLPTNAGSGVEDRPPGGGSGREEKPQDQDGGEHGT
jgi:hypothetical protein